MNRWTLWFSRIGFYLAVLGTASGLGNLWRFPYIVAENGGGAFVLLYVLLVFIVGMPLLIGELMLGKSQRRSIVLGVEELAVQSESNYPLLLKKLRPYIGFTSVVLCLMVLSYFSVISGWVLYYLIKFAQSLATSVTLEPQSALRSLVESGWMQFSLASLHIIAVTLVVSKDIEGGIERFVGYVMPVFGLLLAMLAWKSLSLDTTEQALRFLFYPNFSVLSWASLGQALGHVLFTLSIGFTTMVTFGRALPARSKTPVTGFRIATVDSVASLLAGMLIFPLVISIAHVDSSPLLLFETVPEFLHNLSGGDLFGLGFFLCLYLGAFAGSLSLLDTVVANFKEKENMPRVYGAWLAGSLCLILTFVPSMSSSLLRDVQLQGHFVLEFLDMALIDWGLPIVALLVSQFIYYSMPMKNLEAEFSDPRGPLRPRILGQWQFAMKWVIPGITVVALVLQVIGAVVNF